MNSQNTVIEKLHKVDFCVVGGGLAGMIAAIAAAREGIKVALMHDRPVLGGNASSEIRMWVMGCHGKNNRETGILEEILLENMYRNPTRNYSIWDSILFEKVSAEKNIILLLNCSCNNLQMDGSKIKSIKGWQLTTYTWHTVEAGYFADCSGDSILAPLSGAEYRTGREAKKEFGEDIAPEMSDTKTMGMSCLIQARQTEAPIKYTPPQWALVFDNDDALPFRNHDLSDQDTNFWWMELGGTKDSIHDTEELRDELLKIAFGVWDHIKNRGDHNADNWELEWVGFLPGKRESIRYVGDYIMTQNDVRKEGRFNDIVAYGGWSMDDHHPEGFKYTGKPTIFHSAPAPYGIAYRCLYSKNIENLFFAGRNISTTHTALSSTRVMATCAVIGQAVGTAASLAVKNDISPRMVHQDKIGELQQKLMENDCYLPWESRQVPELTKNALLTASENEPEYLRNGIERSGENLSNRWEGQIGSWVKYEMDDVHEVNGIRLVFDSDLERETCTGHPILRRYPMICNRFLNMEPFGFPKTMVKSYTIEYLSEDNNWRQLIKAENNYQRLVKHKVNIKTKALRFIAKETWGSEKAYLFAWDFK